jgi:thiosulfate/3-mercaptopyruvate sulfurtransferase
VDDDSGRVSDEDIGVEELSRRLDELVVLDVRSEPEFDGSGGYPCDPRQGHIPGARNLDLARLFAVGSVEEVRELVGEAAGAEVVTYCHSGSRSRTAAQILDAAGYRPRNYAGSWHEWSRRDDLPVA